MSASEDAEMLLARATCAAVALSDLPPPCRVTLGFSLDAPPEVVMDLAARLGCEVTQFALGKTMTVLHGFTTVLHGVSVSFSYFARGES